MLKALSIFVWTLWGGMDKDFNVKYALETSSTLAILGHTDLFIQAMAQMSSVNKLLSKLGPFSVTESSLPLPAARNERLIKSKKRPTSIGFCRTVSFHDILLEFSFHLKDNIIIILVHETPQTIILNCLQWQSFTHQKPLWWKICHISKTLAALGCDCYAEQFFEAV